MNSIVFATTYRFDMLRPLYDGWNDYLAEIRIALLDSLAFGCDVVTILFGTLWLALFTAYSVVTSLFGLISRSVMTAILGINDDKQESIAPKMS